MKKGYQKDKTLARGKDVHIGIDVHKENWHVSARVEGAATFVLICIYLSANSHLVRSCFVLVAIVDALKVPQSKAFSSPSPLLACF